MASEATTVQEYLDELPDDRRAAIQALRKVIRANLDKKLEEGIQYGMIGYYLPHSVYPAGYHCDPKQPLPFASVASQKNHIGLSLFCLYGNDSEGERFREEWLASGKRLDMGKSCIRIKKLDDIPLDVVGRAVKRMTAKKFVAHYEGAIRGPTKAAAAGKKVPNKATVKKAPIGKKGKRTSATKAR